MVFGKVNGEARLAQLGIVLIALVLRLLIFPHRDQTRGFDEEGYLTGSLAILEGLPAGYKAAPAGPNTWVGWIYAGGTAAWYTIHPGPEECAVPMQIRPFLAINHALFDHYRDLSKLHELWILTQLLLTLYAVHAAFRFGWNRAGLAGGILFGGLLATLPMYVDFTMMSRPYMTAWAFAVLSLDAAARDHRRRILLTGIYLGLAIASRVEMVLFVPVVLWEFWHRPTPCCLRGVCKIVAVTVATALLAAPWLLTHLVGNLRTIATVRMEGADLGGSQTLAGLLQQLAWSQGLILIMLGALLALVLAVLGLLKTPGNFSICAEPDSRPTHGKTAILAGYLGLLFLMLLPGKVALHQQGAAVLSLIIFSLFSLTWVHRQFPRATIWIALLAVIFPLVQTLKMVQKSRQTYTPDGSTAWVEAHVPAGTTVYLKPGLQNLLPTPGSATVLWAEVNDDIAWQRKFESGMKRFGLSSDEIPRALSDENLVQERGNRRGLFILGSRPALPDPRYDIRLYDSSPVFGVHDIDAAYKQTGGVVISQGAGGLPQLGTPVAQWTDASGNGTFVYCSPDVVKHLQSPAH